MGTSHLNRSKLKVRMETCKLTHPLLSFHCIISISNSLSSESINQSAMLQYLDQSKKSPIKKSPQLLPPFHHSQNPLSSCLSFSLPTYQEAYQGINEYSNTPPTVNTLKAHDRLKTNVVSLSARAVLVVGFGLDFFVLSCLINRWIPTL